jgi:hypothetical protein
MTKSELLGFLRAAAELNNDPEGAHVLADDAIIAFIGDDEIKQAYDAVKKYYG